RSACREGLVRRPERQRIRKSDRRRVCLCGDVLRTRAWLWSVGNSCLKRKWDSGCFLISLDRWPHCFNTPTHENSDSISSHYTYVRLCVFARSASSYSAARRGLSRVHYCRRDSSASKPHHRCWKHRSWVESALCRYD